MGKLYFYISLLFLLIGSNTVLKKDLFYLKNLLDKNNNSQIVLDGDSRTYQLISNQPNINNISYFGKGNIGDTILKLKYLIRNKRTPKVLVVPAEAYFYIDPRYKETEGSDDAVNFNLKRYSCVYSPISLSKTIYKFSIVETITCLFPILNSKTRLDWVNQVRNGYPHEKIDKIKWNSFTSSRKKKSINVNMQYYYSKKYINKTYSLLRRLLNICKNNNIVLVGIKTPTTIESKKETRGKATKVKRILQAFEFDYILDYSNIFESKSNKNFLFADHTHINRTGRAVIRDRVTKDLVGILLESRKSKIK